MQEAIGQPKANLKKSEKVLVNCMRLSIAFRQNVKEVLRSLRFIAKVRQGLSFNLHCFSKII
jgi:hypothetical protein